MWIFLVHLKPKTTLSGSRGKKCPAVLSFKQIHIPSNIRRKKNPDLYKELKEETAAHNTLVSLSHILLALDTSTMFMTPNIFEMPNRLPYCIDTHCLTVLTSTANIDAYLPLLNVYSVKVRQGCM